MIDERLTSSRTAQELQEFALVGRQLWIQRRGIGRELEQRLKSDGRGGRGELRGFEFQGGFKFLGLERWRGESCASCAWVSQPALRSTCCCACVWFLL